MKKIHALTGMILMLGFVFTSQAQTGEQIFLQNSDECLVLIEKSANDMSITGATMVAYIPGDSTLNWVSKMKVVNRLATDKINFLAVIYAKAAEMAVTLQNSGNNERKDIIGELGWQGGVIVQVNSGYILAAFSGGTGEEDAAVSKIGLEWLAKKFK